MLLELFVLLRDFVFAFWEVMRGLNRNYIENSMYISAPKAKVWDTLWSSSDLQGQIPVSYNIEPISSEAQLYQVSLSMEGICQTNYMQVLQISPNQAFIADKFYDLGDDLPELKQKFALNLIQDRNDEATFVHQYDFTENLGFFEKLAVSFETRWMLRTFKEHCEAICDTQEEDQLDDPKDHDDISLSQGDAFWGFLSAFVVFSGCAYIYDLSWAICILMILSFHEFGHLVALDRLGVRVSNLFALPFMGSAALAQIEFRSKINDAFCSLMGPILSLILTFLFFILYFLIGDEFFGKIAAIFSLVNLFHLIPITPFVGNRLFRLLLPTLKTSDVWAGIFATAAFCFLIAISHGYMIFGIIGGIILLCCINHIHEILIDDEDSLSKDKSDISCGLSENAQSVISLVIIICLLSNFLILNATTSIPTIAAFLGIA